MGVSRLKGTFELIKKLRPMIKFDELKEYEKVHGLGRFDVWFKQKDDLKTIYGDSQMKWRDTPLKPLGSNIYDYFYHNYEMWVRETTPNENDSAKISDENIRYVISLEADNVSEDKAVLDCRIVNGWLVMSAQYDATFNQRRRFFVEFGHVEPFKLGPSGDDADILYEYELDNLTDQKILEFGIHQIRSKKLTCLHCTEETRQLEKLLERYDALDLDEKYDEVLTLEKQALKSKNLLSKEKFYELMDKIKENKKKFLDDISERDDYYFQMMNIDKRKLYRCNICKTIFCNNRMNFKRVCSGCTQKIYQEIMEQKKHT